MKNILRLHSSVLAWRIQGTAEPGGLLSMGSHRVRHDWSDLAAAAKMLKWMTSKNWIVSERSPYKLLLNSVANTEAKGNCKKREYVYDLQQTERILEKYFVSIFVGMLALVSKWCEWCHIPGSSFKNSILPVAFSVEEKALRLHIRHLYILSCKSSLSSFSLNVYSLLFLSNFLWVQQITIAGIC